MTISSEQVLDALRVVNDPDLHRDIVSLGFVKELNIEGDKVSFHLELTTPACPVKDLLKEQAEDAVLALPGVTHVDVTLTARVRESFGQTQEQYLPGVRNVFAVASGKGGVGKSTATINLALALAQSGARVGILDADVYGPSIPLMLGCEKEKPFTRNQKILPVEKYGIKTMSLGYLLEEGQQPMWRGPMVAGTVKQLLGDVEWGELDYLLVDLPPGTGDAPMTLAQSVPLTGVILVTTPHHVAANIAGRSILLFQKLNTPILGVVENMAGFVCPNCNTLTPIFSGLTGEDLAHHYAVPYLGSIPLDPVISAAMEGSQPAILEFPDALYSKAFHEVAGRIARQASIRAEAFQAQIESAGAVS